MVATAVEVSAILSRPTPHKRRPGHIPARTPGLLSASAHKGTTARPLCTRGTALSSPIRDADGRSARDLSTLQLCALRSAGSALPALRPRQHLLCRAASASRAAPGRAALSAKLSRRLSACRTPAGVAGAAKGQSDASGFPRAGLGAHSAGHLHRAHFDRCSYPPWPRSLPLLSACPTSLRPAWALARWTMNTGRSNDPARARSGDPASTSRRAVAAGHNCSAVARASQYAPPRTRPSRRAAGATVDATVDDRALSGVHRRGPGPIPDPARRPPLSDGARARLSRRTRPLPWP